MLFKEQNLKWYSNTIKILEECGFYEPLNDKLLIPPEVLIKNVKQYLTTQYTHRWLNKLQTTTGKLRTFKQVKHTFKYESYLDLPFHLHSTITRLRISNHNLKIETGRYNLPSLPVNEKTCFNCFDKVEDELHFLLSCPAYQTSNEFTNLITCILNLNDTFNDFSDIDKWIFISSSEDQNMNYLLGKFIIKANEIRNNLINGI